MKCVISTTYSDTYLYFLPITVFCWNKLNVDVICFMPTSNNVRNIGKMQLIHKYFSANNQVHLYDAPEHKEATYAQCSRLYGACLDLPEDEVLVTGDVDMAMFQIPQYVKGTFSVFGADLVPEKQVPMCYLTATVKQWRETFRLCYGGLSYNPKDSQVHAYVRSYQHCLDDLLGDIECESFRGNYWGKDQEEAFNKINSRFAYTAINRAREGTTFAGLRYDRDDAYILDRLSPDTIDFHMPRPGFEDKNFEIILTILKYHYPQEDFTWLVDFTNAYKQLL